ncbi:hypothetical protein [Paenibacillus dendritiformis]|nr:hypothetical protein [Paenibacillus dendritiformis]
MKVYDSVHICYANDAEKSPDTALADEGTAADGFLSDTFVVFMI